MNTRVTAALAALALGAGAARALVFEPRHDQVRVKVQRFETAGFPRVDMFFKVESGHKQDLRYLREPNLRLFEEEVEIKDFSVELEQPPLSVALVLDDSGSVDPELEYLKKAAGAFVDELHRLDEVSVVSFHRRAELLQPRTQSKQRMKEAIAQLRGYGATAVYDGAVLGFESIREGRGERKMLLLTDGNDQIYHGGRALSLSNEERLIAQARAEGVEVYTIGLGQHVNMDMLRRVAHKTGGQCWYAPRSTHLREVFDAVARSMVAQYRVRYVSPNARREKLDRTVTLDLSYQGHNGRGVGTYWLEKEIPVAPVSVKREKVAGAGPGKFRLFTSGLRNKFLQVDFTLRRPGDGEVVRAGRTTIDGFGRLNHPEPLLVNIPPATYELELKIPDQEVRFKIPDIEIVGGETATRVVNFSRLVFHRDGAPWYDMQHPYGPTSELITARIEDGISHVAPVGGTAGEAAPIFAGRLSDLKHHREVAVWLPEGIYVVTLENLWKDEDPAETDGLGAPLVNRLQSRIQVVGGRELRFDVHREDLAAEEDVLDPEYLASHFDENPFLRDRPETEQQLDNAIRRRRAEYMRGDFRRHEAAMLGWGDGLYKYRNPDEIRAKVAELTNRYDGPEPAGDAPEIDETYLADRHLGPAARKRRLDDIAGHFLGPDNPSFPGKATATREYTGGPGDRYADVAERRARGGGFAARAKAREARAEAARPRTSAERLAALREKVALRTRSRRAPSDTPIADPQRPGVTSTIGALVERSRAEARAELNPEIPVEDLHNLDRLRRR